MKPGGADKIKNEVYKNPDIWINVLYKLFGELENKNMPRQSEVGVIVFIYKKGGGNELRNYRPIVLLITVYKIRETIITNKLIPLFNILTRDNQCANKTKKSTMDIIYRRKSRLLDN